MMRVLGSGIVVAVFAAFAAPACKGSSASAQEVVAGVPAGDVTEVSGDVHATRDGKTRAIAKGDVVSGDDVIATAGDGRVTIVLRHNHVPWSLGPNKEKKVADSAAWSAAAGASGEQVTDDHSTAAGRHAERSATDTGVSATETAPAPAAPASATAVAPPPVVQPAEPPPKTVEPPPPAVQPTAPPPPSRRAPPPPPDDRAVHAKIDGIGPVDGEGGGDFGSLSNASGVGTAGGGAPGGPGGTGTIGGGAPGGGGMRPPNTDRTPIPRITIGEVDSNGGLTSDVVAQVLRRRQGLLRACYQHALQQDPSLAGLLMVDFQVGADGSVSRVRVDGSSELSSAGACMKKQISNAKFPAAADASHVNAKIVLAPESP